MAKKEPRSVRYEKLLAVAREMAHEYEILCQSMGDYGGCESCPMNTIDMDGGSCKWYGDMYMKMSDLGVLDDE